jgi:hypothetical protein
MTNGLRSFLGTDYGDLMLVKIRDAGLWRGQSLADAAIAPHQRAYGKECEGTAAALHFGFD